MDGEELDLPAAEQPAIGAPAEAPGFRLTEFHVNPPPYVFQLLHEDGQPVARIARDGEVWVDPDVPKEVLVRLFYGALMAMAGRQA